jgi:hypothetical protein
MFELFIITYTNINYVWIIIFCLFTMYLIDPPNKPTPVVQLGQINYKGHFINQSIYSLELHLTSA